MKGKMQAGQRLMGAMVNEVPLPNLMKVYKTAGLDYAIIDAEHGPFDKSQLAAMIAVANAVGLPVLVRLPGNDRELILKTLEMGADGLLLPMANTRQIVEKLVEYGKYAPVGKRGLAGTRAHCGYRMGDVTAYMEKANKRTMLFAQIETQEALDNCEDILATEGLDGVYVGPMDLSVDLGVAGHVESPLIGRAIERVAACGKRAGKPVGIITSNKKLLGACGEKGMTLFCCGNELSVLLKGLGENVSWFKENFNQ